MKKVFIIFLIISLMPFFAQANSRCVDKGYTVVYVNGIFTSEAKAKKDLYYLNLEFKAKSEIANVKIINGYNPSHIAGAGDLVQAVSQALLQPSNTFDRDTILMDIHGKINTQKILLLGHSQGTFYTNELYDYLINHGVPQGSIFVYNLATPASFVAGGGKYLTSANDGLIKKVLEASAVAGTRAPLPANTIIPVSDPSVPELWQGHAFSTEYLAGAPFEIISSVDVILKSLNADTRVSGEEGCFDPPNKNIMYKANQMSFAVIDGVANGTLAAGKGVTIGVKAVARGVQYVASNAVEQMANIFRPRRIVSSNQASVVSSLPVLPLEDFEVVEIEVEEVITPTLNETESVAVSETVDIVEEVQEIQNPKDKNSQPEADQPLGENTEETVGAGEIQVESPGPIVPPLVIISGFGGGAPPQVETVENIEPVEESEEVPLESEDPQVNPVSNGITPPTITSPSPETGFATTTITFTGTSTPGYIVSTDYSSATATAGQATTTVDGSGDWSFTLDSFSQGTTTVGFSVRDEYSLTSSTTTIDVFVDTVAPSISSFAVEECDYSLSSSICLVLDSSVTLTYESLDTDISYFTISKDDVVLATSTVLTHTESISLGESSFFITAYDALGNTATSSRLDVARIDNPIVINEVAWAGTEASSYDEWIELYNRSSYDIDMSRITLHAEDLVPYIPLTGTLMTGDYYLIERGDSTATSESEDLATAFSGVGGGSGLLNGGEVLYLSYSTYTATTTLDATPALSDCAGTWCAGLASTTPITMERVNTSVSGTTASNWKSNDTYTVNGTDADSNAILGTPGSRNSVNLLEIGFYCTDDSSTYQEGGYYTPTTGFCTYISTGFTAKRWGILFKGTVASSTEVGVHYLGTSSNSTQNGDNLTDPVQGEEYFVAIFETGNSTPVRDAFRDFFKTGANPPPTLNYGVLNWNYGTAP